MLPAMKNPLRRALIVAAFALFGVCGYFVLQGPQGIPALRQAWSQIRTQEEENANLQREIKYREGRIKKLQESPSEQELEIRKKLKLLRPGETSFILPDQPKHDESTPAPSSESK